MLVQLSFCLILMVLSLENVVSSPPPQGRHGCYRPCAFTDYYYFQSYQMNIFNLRVGSTLGLQDVRIQKIFKHGAYNSKTNDNDIALIKLKTPVKITRDVKPACLPKTVLVPGTKCFLVQRRYGLCSVSFYKFICPVAQKTVFRVG